MKCWCFTTAGQEVPARPRGHRGERQGQRRPESRDQEREEGRGGREVCKLCSRQAAVPRLCPVL
eukprot:2458632-Rhodomonas_salina.2